VISLLREDEMSVRRHAQSARIPEKIESAIRSAIKRYEKQHDLVCCEQSYDPDEIRRAEDMLPSAGDSEVRICIEYTIGYRKPGREEVYSFDFDHRTSRVHLCGNASAFMVEVRQPGSCQNHKNVLIPDIDLLSKGKAALLEEAERGNATAMFALSRLFAEGVGEPQDPVEAYFWHFVGMEFCEFGLDGEGFVDAADDQELLAAKLPKLLAEENSSLHKRATEWIERHRALLQESHIEEDGYLDDDWDD
jgi:hypothetical protein